MPITYRIAADTAEELPEALRKGAKNDNGKFVVDALPDGFALEDVRGLKNTVQTLRGEAKASAELAKAFIDAGLTTEEAKAAAEALAKMKAGQLKSSSEIDAFKVQLEKKLTEQAEALNKKLARRTEEVIRGGDIELSKLLQAAGADPEAIEFLLDRTKKNIRWEEDAEGNLKSYVVGDDGKTPAITKKSGMGPMGKEELVEQLQDVAGLKKFFLKKGTGGSGASSQSGGSGQPANPGQKMSARDLLARAHASTAK